MNFVLKSEEELTLGESISQGGPSAMGVKHGASVALPFLDGCP